MGPNEKLLRQAYADFDRGDIDALLAVMSDSIVVRAVGSPLRLDHPGEWHGIEGMKRFLNAILANWTFPSRKVLEVIAQKDTRFVVRSAVTGVHKLTGGRASIERADFVSMANGKVVSYQEIFDTAPLERASRL